MEQQPEHRLGAQQRRLRPHARPPAPRAIQQALWVILRRMKVQEALRNACLGSPRSFPGPRDWDRVAKRCRQRHSAGEIRVYSSAQAVPQSTTGGEASTADIIFLTILEATSLRSRCWQDWFALRPVSSPRGRPSSMSVFMWSSLCFSVSSSGLTRTPVIALGPTAVNSLNLTHLLKGSLQIQSHSEILGGRTSTYEFWGDTTEPITQGVCRDREQEPTQCWAWSRVLCVCFLTEPPDSPERYKVRESQTLLRFFRVSTLGQVRSASFH